MHKPARMLFAAAAMVLVAELAPAQTGNKQPEMTPEQKAEMEAYAKAGAPGPQHQALAAAAGSYDVMVKSWHDAAGPAIEEKGTVTRSMIMGGRVMVEEFSSTMMGEPFTGHGMMGYDNVSGKYWSTWNDSMSTGVMVSDGTCDAGMKNCTFTGGWNDPITKKFMKVRMTTKHPSPTTEVFEMHGPDRNGKEFKMMELTYTRKS